MNAKKREFLVTHLGEEETKRLETNTAELKSALEAKGVEWKDVPEDAAIGPIDMKELASKAAKAAAEALVETPAFKAMVEAQAGYESRFKGIEEALAALKKTDDEKVAQLVAARPTQTNGHVATRAEANVLDAKAKEEALAEGPSFFDEIMEGLETHEVQQ
ncbi:hypothetical protein LCGC14_2255810 [marine sediment metagenome]|uniref:Uncharacterized protein n=1 Tax=marine sediment metagenome TaxID=412755 RepID=A0A0F9FW90_9ZZZZ